MTLHLDPPVTFNEKIQWLKLHDRKPVYAQISDKHAAREYIARRIGEPDEQSAPLHPSAASSESTSRHCPFSRKKTVGLSYAAPVLAGILESPRAKPVVEPRRSAFNLAAGALGSLESALWQSVPYFLPAQARPISGDLFRYSLARY